MTSSDGFYSPPCWQTPDNSPVSSSSALAPSGEEETGQSQIGALQVDKQSSWVQVSAETCSDEQPVIYRPFTPPTHTYLQLTETVLHQTQNCQTGPPLDVPGSPSFSQKHSLSPESTINNPVDFQDGLAPEGVPRTHEANQTFTLYPVQAEGLMRRPCLASGQLTNTAETLAGHGSVGEQSESVLFLPEAVTDGEPSQPMTDKDSNDSVEEHCQDPLSPSAAAVQNVCLQLTETVAWHTLDLHAASAVDVPGSQSPEHSSGLVSSEGPDSSVQSQEWLDSDRPPRTHSEDETFKSDPVVTLGLSPQPGLGSRNLTDASEAAVAAQGCVGEHGEAVSWLTEMGSDAQVVQPVPDEVTSVHSFEENGQDPQSTSAAECPSKVTVGSACSEPAAGAVVCPTHAGDTHTASALGVCGSPSPSPQYNSVPVCSDDALHIERAHITHTADLSSGLDPETAGDLRVASETLAGVGCAKLHGESAALVSDAGMGAGEVAQPLPDEVTAADPVEEKRGQAGLCSSADALQHVGQRDTVGALSPSTVEEDSEQQPAPSHAAGSTAACPDGESLADCAPHTDPPAAAGATDASAKDKQTQTGRCDTQLQNSHQHSQPSPEPWESAGQPYSLRRRRRGAPTCGSAPGSAKRSCPGLEQSCSSSSSSTSTPVEGCSQDGPPPLAVPVKRKRGRPRKTPQAVDLSEASSGAPVHAGKADSRSAVCDSTVTEDRLDEAPDTSLSTRLRLKRTLAAAEEAPAASGEAEGQENTHLPLDPPFTLRTDAQQSQESSQEAELPAAPCSDLSLEQILQDDPMPLTPLSLPEDGEEEEDPEEEEEELPSILERKPMSITEGLCVWCKFRKYPFWPAVVKSVNHKNKKASIVFIDTFLIDEKGIRKGLTVSLKTLKPLDCEDAEELTEQARQQYGEAITWCLELIYDYRIRIGCGSFSGSFIEYFASEISCPLRQKYSQGTSDLTFPTQLIVDDLCDSAEEDGVGEQVDGQQCKKLLPDRARAARTRANEKLVDFIVRKRGAERRLLAVISGQEASKWLRALQKGSRFVVDPYLEDEEQVDQVYRYLDEFFRKTPQALPCLAHLERIPFILDVLLPEALICAIAGVDDISLEQAEEKYRKGPCISKRERQEFNVRIEELMKTLNQCKQVL